MEQDPESDRLLSRLDELMNDQWDGDVWNQYWVNAEEAAAQYKAGWEAGWKARADGCGLGTNSEDAYYAYGHAGRNWRQSDGLAPSTP